MKKIRKTIQHIINPIAKKMGYVRRGHQEGQQGFEKNSLLHTFFTTIIQMGFDPKHIVDVGANHGTWTRETLTYFPNSHYSLVEPQNWLQSSFQDILDANPKVKYYPIGAGRENGSFKFTIVERDDSCSFRYSEEEARQQGYRQVNVPISTLDDLVKSNNLPVPDIIKIDAEGLDIEVLKGASELFGKTEIFMVEAAVVLKQFDNSFLKMINFMDQNGYRLFDITDLNRPFPMKVLWLVELAFVKKNGLIDSYKITP